MTWMSCAKPFKSSSRWCADELFARHVHGPIVQRHHHVVGATLDGQRFEMDALGVNKPLRWAMANCKADTVLMVEGICP